VRPKAKSEGEVLEEIVPALSPPAKVPKRALDLGQGHSRSHTKVFLHFRGTTWSLLELTFIEF